MAPAGGDAGGVTDSPAQLPLFGGEASSAAVTPRAELAAPGRFRLPERDREGKRDTLCVSCGRPMGRGFRDRRCAACAAISEDCPECEGYGERDPFGARYVPCERCYGTGGVGEYDGPSP